MMLCLQNYQKQNSDTEKIAIVLIETKNADHHV